MKYVGSEEFIRLQFEEYILALIASAKYHNYLLANPHNPKAIIPEVEGDPINDFGLDWLDAWKRTENYRMWHANTDSHLFDIVDPKHPCAGGLTIDDVQRRIAEQVKELHLDERFAQGKEVLGRNIAAGREKASFVLNKLYADMEALREAQRRRAEEARANGGMAPASSDAHKTPATGQTASARAGAYVSSWTTWASEKRRTSGWGGGWGRKTKSDKTTASPVPSSSPIEKDYHIVSAPETRTGSSEDHDVARPQSGVSFSESILSGVSDSPGRKRDTMRSMHENGGTKDDGFHIEGVTGSRDQLSDETKPAQT